MKSPRRPFSAIAALALAVGCSTTTGPGSAPKVGLSFSTQPPAGVVAAPSRSAALGAAVTGADTLTDGADTLIITSAQLVLEKIELERQDVASCDVEPEPAGCEEFETGPVLVDLPLGTGTMQQVAVDIPSGTYTEVKFDIHKLSSGAPADATLLTQYPDLAGVSIRVQGTYNGTPFTYQTDLDVEQELEFATPLVVSDGTTTTNVTIRVVLADWFKSSNGGLLDPSSANVGQPNEGIVKENIKNSMKAFEDRNEDGDERNG